MLEHEKQFSNKASTLKQEIRTATDPHVSTYISASAGSGKTTLLINRILRVALKITKLSSVLCIAFTNAAADEIKSRLCAKASRWMICDEDELISELNDLQGGGATKEEIEKARGLFAQFLQRENSIRIQTIHSFCSSVLKAAVVIDDAGNDIIENGNGGGQATILDKVAKQKMIEEAFDEAMSIDVISDLFLERLAKQWDLGTVKDMVINAIAMPVWRSEPNMQEIHQKCRYVMGLSDLSPEMVDLQDDKGLTGGRPSERHGVIHNIEEYYVKHGYIAFEELTAIIGYEESVVIINEWLMDVGNIEKFHAYSLIFLRQDLKPRVKVKIIAKDDKSWQIIQCQAHELAKVWEKINEQQSFQLLYDFSVLASIVRQKFVDKKRMILALEYDDLLHNTLNLMRDQPHILHNIDNKIDHLLVDEAQDLSLTQWDVIHAITSEFYSGEGARGDTNRTVFIVGDYKQSIFGFQGAEPRVFLGIKDFYHRAFREAKKPWYELELSICYRCHSGILSSVDNVCNGVDLFGFADGGDTDEQTVPPVDHDQLLIKHTAFKEDNSELEYRGYPSDPTFTATEYKPVIFWSFIPEIGEKSNEWFVPTVANPENIASKSMQMANFICKKTLEVMKMSNPKDSILILFRKRSDLLRDLIALLRSNGINVEGEGGKNNLLLADLLAVGRFALQPLDDLNLACLLKSPFVGVNDNQLFELCYGRDISLWQNIRLKKNVASDRGYSKMNHAIDENHKIISDSKSNMGTETEGECGWISSIYQKLCEFLSIPSLSAQEFYINLLLSGDHNRILQSYNGETSKEAFFESFINKLHDYHESRLFGGTLEGFIQWADEREEEFSNLNKYNTCHVSNERICADIRIINHGEMAREDSIAKVKIATVHTAKGSEADIVILADASYTDNVPYEPIIVCDDWFILNASAETACNSLVHIKERRRRARCAEDMRLLYVAMTRAKKALYVVEDGLNTGGWAEIISRYNCI